MKLTKILLGALLLGGFTACNDIEQADRYEPIEVTAKKNVLIEDFTGQHCVNCPKAADEIQRMQADSTIGEHVIAVSIHGGSMSKHDSETSGLGLATDEGETYNINADVAAGEIAGALKAEKLLVLTDVRGIYSAYPDESSFISTLSFEKAHELILKGSIDGGMIPKVRSCIKALSGGAKKTHIIDGRAEHSILMELFSDKGVGTEVVKEI